MKPLFSFLGIFLSLSLITTDVNAFHDGVDGHDHGLLIDQPWARTTGKRKVSAAIYMKINNEGAYLDKLLSVKTDIAEIAQIHRSYKENGITRMGRLDDLPIAPGEELAFTPGGYHVMLLRLKEPLSEGNIFFVTLDFEKAGEVNIPVQITGIAGLKGF